MRFVLELVLLGAPCLLLLAYLFRSGSLTLMKLAALAAMFIGGGLAYADAERAGLCALILAIVGGVCYVEEIRKDLFREMKRLSDAEEGRKPEKRSS